MKNKKEKKEKKEVTFTTENYSIFTIVKNLNSETKPIILTLGNYKLEEFEDIEECKNYVDNPNYDLILKVIFAALEVYEKNKHTL